MFKFLRSYQEGRGGTTEEERGGSREAKKSRRDALKSGQRREG
jgi:hypothetical protein